MQRCSILWVIVARDEAVNQALANVLVLGHECIPESVGMPLIRQTISIRGLDHACSPDQSPPVLDLSRLQTTSFEFAVVEVAIIQLDVSEPQ